MAGCETCVHFRSVRPPSHALAGAVTGMEPKVADTLSQLGQDEDKIEGAEAAAKERAARTDQEQPEWPTRPLMSAYCGVREANGVFFVAEVKNRGGECGDHTTEGSGRTWCRDCTHRVPGAGVSEDAAM